MKNNKITNRFGKRRGCSIEYAILPYAKIINKDIIKEENKCLVKK